MFVSFDLLALLFWIFVSFFVPGAIIGFAVFKKEFLCIEKLFIGFAIAFVILPLMPFLLYFIAGVPYSYELVLISVAVLYIVSIALFVKNKAYQELQMPKIDRNSAISAILFVILVLSFLVRIGSYSPIFQELDPYFYTYSAQQLLVLGENIEDDRTSWYPEEIVNHRVVPALSYLEAIWYSLYTGGGGYDHLLLSLIAGIYPPIAAVLAVFFIYLLVSAVSGREWGLISAGIAAFVPIFIYKLSAGEMEVQPYAFFSLMFLYAMYALSMIKKDLRFAALAGLAFAAVSLGSSSQILADASLAMFVFLQAVLYYFKDRDLEYLVKSNAVVFVIGPLAGSLLKNIFLTGAPSLSIIIPFFIALATAAGLYFIRQKVPGREVQYALIGAIAIIGFSVYLFTPVGSSVKDIAGAGFALSDFHFPLDRTIAEQGVAPDTLETQIGFISYTPNPDAGSIDDFFSVILLPFSFVVNLMLSLAVQISNILLGTTVQFSERATSFLMFWVFMFLAAILYSLFKFIKVDDDNLFLLFFAMIMPPFLVGILKAKYTIYAGVLIAVAIGYSLSIFAKNIKDFLPEIKKTHILLWAGILLVLLQFAHNGFAPSLAVGSIQPLYQNDPAALQSKFQGFCDATGDPEVCAAAADPVGYASKGINYQYNQKLCLLSVYSDYAYIQNLAVAPSQESQVAFFRCQRLSTYWMDSMEWINENTEEDASIISWWDYGHWTNFFGQRNSVIRNDHKNHEMIGAVANSYLEATPEELIAYMKAHGSKYALFDIELVASSGSLGGKYGALNYLSCAWNNETTVANPPSVSQCEAEHLWEAVYVSQTPCIISGITNKTGLLAYKVYEDGVYKPYYRNECIAPTTANLLNFCRDYVTVKPVYCVGEATFATGQQTTATYYLNETYPNGDLKLNKAFLQFPLSYPTTMHMGPVTGITLLYTDDYIWLENGVMTSGYEDRKGKFYDSNLYKALFLDYIPGFEQVYVTPNGAVKIYKIKE
ncbi:hypothetical protein JXA56_01615 [Candidatus Micrarchaeota archaeon]|nr:hypothetical protein [Candidatus Micrarchaeota archaeon]